MQSRKTPRCTLSQIWRFGKLLTHYELHVLPPFSFFDHTEEQVAPVAQFVVSVSKATVRRTSRLPSKGIQKSLPCPESPALAKLITGRRRDGVKT
jgi:hypothetical protein